jgi:predicted permease
MLAELWSEVRFRIRTLLKRSETERELDEELRFHIDLEVQKYLALGVTRAEAQRRARLSFGGFEQIKEDTRDVRATWLFEDLWRDGRLACRRLVADPGFSVPTVLTIALGIAVATAVLAMVNAILLRPLPYAEADRLVDVAHSAPGTELSAKGLSPGIFLHYRNHNRTFDELGIYLEHTGTLTDVDTPEQVRAALVSANLFSALSATPFLGTFPSARDRNGVVISHDLWLRRYGADSSVVGRTIEIDREKDVILGVAPRGFHFPNRDTHVWVAWRMESLLTQFGRRAGTGSLYLGAIARLNPGSSTQEAEQDLDRLIHTLPDAFPDVTQEQLNLTGLRAVVTPLKDVIVGDVRTALLALAGTAGFLLLIMWASVTNLSILRAERQRTQVAVERALGATTRRVVQRFVGESVVLATCGGVLGVGLAQVATKVRFGFNPDRIPRLSEVVFDSSVAGAALVLVILTSAFLVVVSLLSVRRSALAPALTGAAGRKSATPATQAGRRLLVTSQVALTLTLLIASTLTAQSYRRLRNTELGFTPASAVTFFLPLPVSPYAGYRATARLHEDVLARLRALPGVLSADAATTSVFPLTSAPAYYAGRISGGDHATGDSASAPIAHFGYATHGYFLSMGIPLLHGRNFDRVKDRNAPNVILSAGLARSLFGVDEAIGKRIQLPNAGPSNYVVIGVVGNVSGERIREGASKVVYFPNVGSVEDGPFTTIAQRDEQYVVRTSLPLASLVPAIRSTIRQVDPKLAMLRIGTLENLVDRSMESARVTMLLLVIGTSAALFLGVIGIYSVLSYSVRQRNYELGLRIALGATPASVVRMVLRQGTMLALGGITIGLVTALALTRFLGSMLYEVSSTSPTAFLGMALLLLAVALGASYAPARRAGRIDPQRALKTH